MKSQLTVKIGQSVFEVDGDAYRILADYLDDIRQRCEPSAQAEVLDDVEMRIADLFTQWLADKPIKLVDPYLVRRAQQTIGRPEDFGELRQPQDNHLGKEEATKKLSRAVKDRVIGGVCGGFAAFMRIDPTLVRVVTMLLVMFGGLSLWIYIILWIFLPVDKTSTI